MVSLSHLRRAHQALDRFLARPQPIVDASMEASWRWLITHTGHSAVDQLLVEYMGLILAHALESQIDPANWETRLAVTMVAARRIGDGALAWLCITQLGQQLAGRADARAEGYLRLAIRLAPTEVQRAESLGTLGIFFHRRGAFPRAIVAYEQALRHYRAIGDRDGCAQTLRNLGLVAIDADQLQRAWHWYHQALRLDQRRGDRHAMGRTWGWIGWLATSMGWTARAVAAYQQAIALLATTDDRANLAIVQGNLSEIMVMQGDLTAAITLLDAVIAYEREVAHPNLAISEQHLRQLIDRTKGEQD